MQIGRMSLSVSDRIKSLVFAKRARDDQEFLPAAISILETPPSPVQVVLIWVICVLAVFALLWSYFGQIDIIALAQGKLQPTGRVKTIQPFEPGRVVDVKVENGQRVKANDVLIELDKTEAVADETASKSALESFQAEKLRRSAVLDIVKKDMLKDTEASAPAISWPSHITGKIREREERVMKADLQQLESIVRNIDAQVAQKKGEIARLEAMIVSEEQLVETLKQRVDLRSALLARGSTPKAAVIDAMESLQSQQTTLAMQKGQLVEANEGLRVLASERQKTIDAFLAENEAKANEAERQIDDLEQKLSKARVRTARMVLTSPIAGTVLGLTVTTRNQVVQSGEELMRIVPDDGGLEVESYAQNKDIGFIKNGQPAIVKIEAFPFTKFGTVDAQVTRVGRDAIPDPEAQMAEGNPARSQKSGMFVGAQRIQNLVFPVTLKLGKTSIGIDGVDVPLTPGMAVTVEIKTGKRRIIEYLLSPLVETTSRAMKER
ncbi:HlyD family type I secretion periplasmic adaptor subunit [Methylocystis sp. IM3]|uniref:HlyD family type I secretion periplasmic adaptor subunit n=1 Tax=unclassified Methylocystis TaxID=2625913 RepID=UPI0030F53C88